MKVLMTGGSGFIGTNLLDVDCYNSPFSLKLAKKGYKVYAIDTRRYPERHTNLTFVQGEWIKRARRILRKRGYTGIPFLPNCLHVKGVKAS